MSRDGIIYLCGRKKQRQSKSEKLAMFAIENEICIQGTYADQYALNKNDFERILVDEIKHVRKKIQAKMQLDAMLRYKKPGLLNAIQIMIKSKIMILLIEDQEEISTDFSTFVAIESRLEILGIHIYFGNGIGNTMNAEGHFQRSIFLLALQFIKESNEELDRGKQSFKETK